MEMALRVTGIDEFYGFLTRLISWAEVEPGRITDKYGEILRDEVRSRSEGPPGPNKVTGDYWESIQAFETSFFQRVRGVAQAGAYSDHPAARRLESGFVGIDSLGRHYAQRPKPHWSIGSQVVGQRWFEEIGDDFAREIRRR